MNKRIEIEKKYFCTNDEGLLKLIHKNKLKKIDESIEVDEYFTDINSEFVRNRTCLRIRKKNNNYMELTFKGKSKDFFNSYAKIENNIVLKIEQYENIVDILYALGYLSYTIVDKKRITYSKEKDNITYNVMIDNIKSIGNFVEFELLYENDDKSIEDLKVLLNNFVDSFKNLNFESADLPYRDFVARKKSLDILPVNNLKNIILDLNNIDIANKFMIYINLLEMLRRKGIKLFLIIKNNLNDIVQKYELNELFEEIIIKDNLNNKIIKNIEPLESVILTDINYEINNIKTIKISNGYNQDSMINLSSILLIIINYVG